MDSRCQPLAPLQNREINQRERESPKLHIKPEWDSELSVQFIKHLTASGPTMTKSRLSGILHGILDSGCRESNHVCCVHCQTGHCWTGGSVEEEVHRLETVYDVTYALSIHHWIELHKTTFISITSITPSTEMSIQTLTWLCLCGRFQTLLKSCSRNQKCVFKLRVGIYASWTHRAEDNVSIRVKHRLCLAAVFFRDKLLRVVNHFY